MFELQKFNRVGTFNQVNNFYLDAMKERHVKLDCNRKIRLLLIFSLFSFIKFIKAHVEIFLRQYSVSPSIHDGDSIRSDYGRFFSQVYVGLSELFCRLQDADKSARYAARAYDLSRSLQLGDLNSRHHRAALLQMAAALRKKGELGDAHDYCSVKFLLKIAREREGGKKKKLTSFRSKIVSPKILRNFSTNVNF